MFGIQKQKLITNLEKLRKNLCCYMGDYCDCKYGNGTLKFSSEATGCPEIRQTISMLYVLTDEEFADICNRAKIILI